MYNKILPIKWFNCAVKLPDSTHLRSANVNFCIKLSHLCVKLLNIWESVIDFALYSYEFFRNGLVNFLFKNEAIKILRPNSTELKKLSKTHIIFLHHLKFFQTFFILKIIGVYSFLTQNAIFSICNAWFFLIAFLHNF
jgi:hypothetical protein